MTSAGVVISTTICILGKEYQIKCPEAALASLEAAAVLLEKNLKSTQRNMPELRQHSVMLMSALNLAYQLWQKEQAELALNQRIVELQQQIDVALNPPQVQLEW